MSPSREPGDEPAYPSRPVGVARSVRLISTARLRDAVLGDLVGPEQLADLEEIEGATSGRLVAPRGQGIDFDPRELVAGMPGQSFVNAAFVYFRPHTLNRFNGPGRGAWYAADRVETSLAEVTFHLTRALDNAGDYHAVVDYSELWASLAGSFVDLRGLAPTPECLDPDTEIGYPAGNALAQAVLARGDNGVIYPSVRDPDHGTCYAVLRPSAVQSVRQGGIWRATWTGHPTPAITPLATIA